MLEPVVIDYESFYSKDYSLSKMSTEAYVRDPRFKAHGAAIKWGPTVPARWYDERELRFVLAQEDWSNKFVIHHHAQFDASISAWHYGVHPAMLGDTLAMARMMIGNHVSVSLDSVRKHFGIPAKITPYGSMFGRTWEEMGPAVQEQVVDGACDEVESIWKIFCLLMQDGFPAEELQVVDLVTKMFSEPVLRGDTVMLARLWEKEATRKIAPLQDLGVTEAELQSADRFAELLRAEGVEPETKDGKNGPIYAFAKNDDFMRDFLLEHESERIRTLAETRLGVKSTILQTRAETLGFAAGRGPLPVYLRYSGAGTLRFSGGDGCLTASTQILTIDISGRLNYKNIVDVQISDLVWDGEEFVEHAGVAFSGYQEVISWDGINGTFEHPVLCGETWKSLGEALRTATPVMDCREPTAWEVETARRCQQACDGRQNQNRCLIGENGSASRVPVYDIVNCGPRHRFGANGKIVSNSNWQNFKRGSDIRRSICAPEGYLLAPVDLSQVEVRVCAWLAGEEQLLETFRKHEDPYCGIASDFYGRPITKKDVLERGTGKQAILSCQYGSSGARFQITAKLGFYGPPVLLELETAHQYVNIYRNKYTRIVQDWRDGDMALKRMANWLSFDWGILRVECNVERGTRRLYFPNGTFIVYDTIEWHEPTAEEVETKGSRAGWRVRTRHGWKNIYGSMLTQNRCEAVSRLIMTQAMIRIAQAGIRPVLSTHDELVFLVRRDGNEERALQFCIDEMTRTPAWAPGLPLEAEGSLGDRYSK